MLCRLNSCGKCTGDLILDGDEWRCWQCGTYYYPKEPVMDLPLESQISPDELQTFDCESDTPRIPARRRTMTNINSVIESKERSETRWWSKNQDIIDRLKDGYSVREISELVGKGQRQIRGVQERLRDIQSSA